MSCEKCEKEPIVGAFYRWKTANIEIIACKEHWLEIREALNKAQSALDTKQEKIGSGHTGACQEGCQCDVAKMGKQEKCQCYWKPGTWIPVEDVKNPICQKCGKKILNTFWLCGNEPQGTGTMGEGKA